MFGPPQTPVRLLPHEAKPSYELLNFKTTWSEFHMPSQTAPAEAKPRYVYSILKPHGQSSSCQVRLLLLRRSRAAYTQFQNHMVRFPDPIQVTAVQGKAELRVLDIETT